MAHDIRIRVIRKQNPDYRKLARALLALVAELGMSRLQRMVEPPRF
jgi:hypothetical protein